MKLKYFRIGIVLFLSLATFSLPEPFYNVGFIGLGAFCLASYQNAWLFFILPLPCVLFFESPGILAAASIALLGRVIALEISYYFTERNRKFASDIRNGLPQEGKVFVDTDIESIVPTSSIREGHLIRVQAGDTVPTDGQITFGSGFVDESHLDGTKNPRVVGMGSWVFSSSIVKNGSFLFRASCTQASSHSARLAVQLEGGAPRYNWLMAALDLLLLTLAFVLRDPIYLVSFSSASVGLSLYFLRQNLRLKSSALGIVWTSSPSQIADSKTVLASETGLLTEGRIRFCDLALAEHSLSEDLSLQIAAVLARQLEHPACYSLLNEIQKRNIPLGILDNPLSATDFASGVFAGEEVSLYRAYGSSTLGGLDESVRKAESEGKQVWALTKSNQVVALFFFEDRLSENALSGLRSLKDLDCPLILVTREEKWGEFLAKTLQIDHYFQANSVEQIEALVNKLKNEKLHPLLFHNLPFKNISETRLPWATGASQSTNSPPGIVLLREDAQHLFYSLKLAKVSSFRTKVLYLFSLTSPLIAGALFKNPMHVSLTSSLAALSLLFYCRLPAKLAFFDSTSSRVN